MTTPRNHATIVYDMKRLKDWLWWRIQTEEGFEDWKTECLKHKNQAIIQTHNGVTLWARINDFDPNHQSEEYVVVNNTQEFLRTIGETCDFWYIPHEARNINRNDRPIAYAQIAFKGIVWQVGRTNTFIVW